MLKKYTSFILALLMMLSCFSGVGVFASEPQADFVCDNVILLIGSGMSQDHINAAIAKNRDKLNLSKFEYSGTITTENCFGKVSDSAAAANALASGYKSENFKIGINSDGTASYTITEAAKDAGKKVGIITDKTICDATPAAFSAKADIKSDYNAITLNQIKSDIDLFFGGGSVYLDRYPEEIAEAGYKYIKSPLQMKNLTNKNQKVIGAFSNYAFDGNRNAPSLSEMFDVATDLLENDNGFFLVLEGGLIDKASFLGNMNDMVSRLVSFDQAVGRAMEYVDANPDTLLVVTGDYEAGTLTLPASPNSMNVVNSCFKSNTITNEIVPFFTYGKNASAFEGDRDNTDIPKMIALSMGIDDFITYDTIIPTDRDYSPEKLKSFTVWNFLNVRKKSNIPGITLTTTSSNNSAITATANSSLMVMANAKVGFTLTVTSPLKSPFVLASSSSDDLSEYNAFVIGTSLSADSVLTIGVGKGNEFLATAEISGKMINEYGDILVEFSEFTPALTPEMVVGLDTFTLSSEGASEKTTYVIQSIDVAKVDPELNYAELLAKAATYDKNVYTADSYAEFYDAYIALKAALTRDERYEAKQNLLVKIDALVPVELTHKSIKLWKDDFSNVQLNSAAYMISGDTMNILSGFAPSSITFNELSGISGNKYLALTLDSSESEVFYNDVFAVTLTAKTSENLYTETIVRPLYGTGKYYFDISSITSDITSIEISINNDAVGAILNISDVEVVTAKKMLMMSTNRRPSSLEILRAAAGFTNLPNGDVNSDGIINVVDALLALRAECGL